MRLTQLARNTVKMLIEGALKSKCELYDIENDKWDRDDLLGNFVLEPNYLDQEEMVISLYIQEQLILTKAQQKQLDELTKEYRDVKDIRHYPLCCLFDLTIQPMLKKELLKYGELPYN